MKMGNQYRLNLNYTKELIYAMNNWNRANPDKFTSEEKIKKLKMKLKSG